MTDVKVRVPQNVVALNKNHDFQPDWRCAKDITPRQQEWFWHGVIPDETTTIFAGSGGIGKSLVLLSLAAHTTTGESFSCCGEIVKLPKGSVILMSAEGEDAIHVVPKLIAMNANLSLIHSIISKICTITKKIKLIQLDKELSIIEDKILDLSKTENPVKLLIIDPVSYFIGGIKDHVQHEVADFIAALNYLADKYKLTIIFNKHRRKQANGQSFSTLADEVGGAAAWTNSPRQALGFIRHPKEHEIFLMGQIKSNLVKSSEKSYNYTIQAAEVIFHGGVLKTSRLVWGDKMMSIGINNASSTELYEKSKTQQCSELIYNHLKENGVSSVKKIIEICNSSNINDRLRQRVIKRMKHDGEIEDAKNNLIPHVQLKNEY